MLASLLAMTLAGPPADAVPPRDIALPDRSIRAGDLATVPGHERTVVGTLPAGSDSVVVSPHAARRLVANRLPGARFALRHSGDLRFTAPAAARPKRSCFRTAADVRPGEVLRAELVEAAECSDEPVAAGLAFDRARAAPVARDGIAAGTYLGAVRPVPDDRVAAGTRMAFVTGEGPVIVEREVMTLQPGRAGGRIFARTSDGEVIAAPVLEHKEPRP